MAERAWLSDLIELGGSSTQIRFASSARVETDARTLAARGTDLYTHGVSGQTAAVLTNDQPSIEVLLGAVASGAALVSLPAPGYAQPAEEYTTFVDAVCNRYMVERVVIRAGLRDRLVSTQVEVITHDDLRPGVLPSGNPGGRFSLTQFSSGTTGPPQGTTVGDDELGANIDALLAVLRPRPGDCAVSWLPISHDMGLVGMLLTTIAAGSPRWTGGTSLTMLEPLAFLRRPASWFETISELGATFTSAPDFAYRMMAETQTAPEVGLSTLRCAIIGGEVIRADTVDALTAAYRSRGLSELALCPAYGLAEAVLGVTITPPTETVRRVIGPSSDLVPGGLFRPSRSSDASDVISSGEPLPGRVLKSPKAAFEVGPISIECQQRVTGAISTLVTPGDLGFVDADGWLYVCGRTDDIMVIRGKNCYAPAVERAIERDLTGLVGNAVVGVDLAGRLVVICETVRRPKVPPDDGRSHVDSIVLRHLGARPDVIEFVGRGQLPRTTSGKVRRSIALNRLATNTQLDEG